MIGELLLRPGAWPLLLVAPAAAAALWFRARRNAQTVESLVGPRTHDLAAVPAWRRRLGPAALGGALLLAIVAWLGPAWGTSERTTEHRGVDVILCLDVSRSMLARDVAPSRLERAHREIRELVARARGDRMALVVFAGEARILVPLTRDVDSLAEMARAADPLSVGRGGTDLGLALETALAALPSRTGEHATVVLVTDGEDAGGRGARVAETCRARGLVVHCVGLGSVAGSKVVVEDERGETFLRDRGGREVVSAMDAAALRRIAETTGGAFIDATQRPNALVGLYDERIVPMARRAFETDTRRERTQRFQVPLAAAIFLWILDLCLARRPLR